jgi:2-octaprenyl-6-methoxyphenol hydroxylase
MPAMDAQAFDVIVAGAGMTGSTAALALASGGLRVALVDPLPFATQVEPTFDGRASAVAYSSFRMLRAMGVGEALEPQAQRIEQIVVTDARSPGAATGAPPPFTCASPPRRSPSGRAASRWASCWRTGLSARRWPARSSARA